MELATEITLRVEEHRDDAHGLLRVVAAVAKRIQRGRHELQRAEQTVDRIRRVAHEKPGHDQEQQQRKQEAGERREHDRRTGLAEAGPDDSRDADLGHPGADQAADERVRAARWNPERPGDQVPEDRAHERAEHDAWIDHIGGDDADADGLRDMRTEEQKGDEIEKSSKSYGCLRPQYACRDDGCDRIGCVVQTVEKIERQRDQNQCDQQRERERDRIHPNADPTPSCPTRNAPKRQKAHTFSSMMPWISLPTSSKRSTTFSR